jgi:hypothetical protein
LLSCPDAAATIDADTVTLAAPDEFTLGNAAARAEVALRGEGLTTSLTRSPAPTNTAEKGSVVEHRVLIAFQ